MLAFVDVETTGTDPDLHEVWEVAVVLDQDGTVVGEYQAFIRPESLAMAASAALNVGHYYERFPAEHNENVVTLRSEAAETVARMTAGCVLASCNVTFDAMFLTTLLRTQEVAPAWHYSPLDVKSLVAGVCRAEPPWSTDELLGLLPLKMSALTIDRHTALGDAHLAREMYHSALGNWELITQHKQQAITDERAALARLEEMREDSVPDDRIPPAVDPDELDD